MAGPAMRVGGLGLKKGKGTTGSSSSMLKAIKAKDEAVTMNCTLHAASRQSRLWAFPQQHASILFTSKKRACRVAQLQSYASTLVKEQKDVILHPQEEEPRSRAPALFRFKHFTLQHGGACAMKMGTDAMLLGAWAEAAPSDATILDVGTGSGVLALMMAQKTQQQHATIHAIDIDAAAVLQATSNAAASPWGHRIHVTHSSLQDWCHHHTQSKNNTCYNMRYDVIISNPPYFLRSSKPGQVHRAAARHADVTLPFAELVRCAVQLLAPGGRLCVVLPVQEGAVFGAEAAAVGLQLTRLTQVYMKSSDPHPKRHLMQFEATPAAAAESQPAQPTAASNADTNNSSSGSGSMISSSGSSAGAAAAVLQASQCCVPADRLVVRVPAQQYNADSSSSSSNSSSNGSSGQAAAAAAVVWTFSDQYRQLTSDFHHPDLLP